MNAKALVLYSLVSTAMMGVGVYLLWGLGASLLVVGSVGWLESVAVSAILIRKQPE